MNQSIDCIHHRLPIYLVRLPAYGILYVPGDLAVIEYSDTDKIDDILRRGGRSTDPFINGIVSWALEKAQHARERWQAYLDQPYKPVCLTVYLSNQCNLRCVYCYSAEFHGKGPRSKSKAVSQSVVEAAAQIVARNCRDKNIPFNLVLHGGGEPSLEWKLLQDTVSLTKSVADKAGIGWFSYIATNGVISENQARWLSRNISLIGLSCDGPPDIQDAQRRTSNNRRTSAIVERTAHILKNEGAVFDVRTTITPAAVDRQVEIVSYLKQTIGPRRIRFEPVYGLNRKGRPWFSPEDAEHFATEFIRAEKKARDLDIGLSYSGVRMNEIHGPYCDVKRNVLRLVPSGKALACLKEPDTEATRLVTGRINDSTGIFVIDKNAVADLRSAFRQMPDNCRGCFNAYHCTHLCPEKCSLTETWGVFGLDENHAGFKCLLHRKLALHWIREASEKLIEQNNRLQPAINLPSQNPRIAKALENAPEMIDTAAILKQYHAVKGRYDFENRRMPDPLWAIKGYENDGRSAWHKLTRHIKSSDNSEPMSIYVHIPFCEKRCTFCDCISRPYGKSKGRIERQYADRLIKEMQQWANIPTLTSRPVTTVHFGGGTPHSLDPKVFGCVIDACRGMFKTTNKTEWAVESTASLISDSHLSELKEWGFKRLHVGVQSLNYSIRKSIGRRLDSEEVLRRIAQAANLGFIISVDIIYGLPAQDVKGLIDDLHRLTEIGVHGISLYRLNASSRNKTFIDRYRQQLPDDYYAYVLFQAADQYLSSLDYIKNHFAHFALPADKNLYYTHANRGEDLLALGASADGYFQGYIYRNNSYPVYLKEFIEGGLAEKSLERKIRPLVSELMCGVIGERFKWALDNSLILKQWNMSKMLKWLSYDTYGLTGNGSFFVYDMIKDLRVAARNKKRPGLI